MGTVYLSGWLVKTPRKKEMALQGGGFQRKGFPIGKIKGQYVRWY